MVCKRGGNFRRFPQSESCPPTCDVFVQSKRIVPVLKHMIPNDAPFCVSGNPPAKSNSIRARTRNGNGRAKCLDKESQVAIYEGDVVGAVGIENNTKRNFKDLGGVIGNAKALIKNNRECKGILIGPSMAPHFSSATEILSRWIFRPLPLIQSRLRAQISRRGWQTDYRTFLTDGFGP